MKYAAAAIIAFAAAASATPSLSGAAGAAAAKRDTAPCNFGTYACTGDDTGIQICNVQGAWELVGPCPDGTACADLPQNGFTLPFCTVPAGAPKKDKAKARRRDSEDSTWCHAAGEYSCLGYSAIQVCDTTNHLQKVGDCPGNSHCEYIGSIPYCVNNYY